MNFSTERSPFNMPELNWYFGYPFALGMMVVTALLLMYYFKRKKWLGRARKRLRVGKRVTVPQPKQR
jgi:hypothetical protein